MKIAIASDHGGYETKEHIKTWLSDNNYEFRDYGTDSKDACDYPIYAKYVCSALLSHEYEFGILICGSGHGMAITANRNKWIRAALCRTVEDAELARKHNNANVMCLGGRIRGIDSYELIVKTFFETSYEGGRHEKRLRMIDQ